jgi:ABC-type sugar transport system ATPase subunit
MASVSFRDIEKSYGATKVIHRISFDIADGEFVVLVGPSGCGKSTLLRMLAGLEEITGGTIAIDDRVVNHVESKDRDIAMVFQSYALYPHMTVAKNIESPLVANKHTRVAPEERQRRVAEAAATLDLTKYLDRKPGELSGGQRQRVALARAIVRKPEVFLMDEPLSNLDAKLRTQTRLELVELHRRLGTTIVYVTHDQVEAMTMADRIAVISDGRLQQVGPPQAVYERPANLFVASFIGSPPMNTVPGTLSLATGTAVVHTAVGSLNVGDPGTGAEGASVVVGIRPEHLALAPASDTALRATVENVELLGHERHVVCTVGDGLMTIRQPNDTPPPAIGTAVGLVGDPTGVHLFDAATTERLN